MGVSHVLALFDGSPAGERVLIDAAHTAREHRAPLSVLVLAAVEKPSRCCNMHTIFWNGEMRRLADRDRARAQLLVPDDIPVEVVLREGRGHRAALAAAKELGCDLVLEPRRRRRPPRRSVLA